MKTNTNKNQIKAQSRPEQLSTNTGDRPKINMELRRANRQMETEKLLALLRSETPNFFELAEVVGKWVWIQFSDKQAATKTRRAGESRGEKCLHQFPGESVTDHKAAKADQVQIIVFDALMSRKILMNQAGPHSCHFVRANRCPDTAATNAHTAIHRSGGNRAGQWRDKIRIVIVLFRPTVPEVNHFMSGFTQFPGQIFF
jgi:hypothetical protein